MWRRFYEEEGRYASMNLVPFGGKWMRFQRLKLHSSHRAGNIYKIMYIVGREEVAKVSEIQKYLSWSRRFYRHMTPYISKSPRQAYANYRDLDVGVNNIKGNTTYAQASIWGFKYFKKNFNKLVHAKSLINPKNFFKHEQSILLV
ncbi:hypothetical protein DITRI_Ditri04bG0180500 [Diplodiscus trichospermus]